MTHDPLHRHSTLRIRDIASFIALAIVCLRVGLAIAAPADAAGDADDGRQVRAVTVKGVAGERSAIAFPLSLSVSASATARTDMATDGGETDAGPRSLAVGVAGEVRVFSVLGLRGGLEQGVMGQHERLTYRGGLALHAFKARARQDVYAFVDLGVNVRKEADRQVRDSQEIVLGAGVRACLFKHVLIGLEGGLVQGGLAPNAWDLPAATRELITDHRRPEGQFTVTVGVVL